MFKRLILLSLALVLGGALLTQSASASKKHTVKWEKADAPVSLPILMYHSVENKPGNGLCVPPEQLEQQLKYLHEQGYYTVTPAEAYKILAQNKVPKKHKKLVMVTFDDGYENNYTAAYPLLKKYHIHATIGLITSKVDTQGMLTLKQVKEMKKSKWVSFVSHTQNHQELNQLDEAGQREEMQASRTWLKQNLHQKPDLLVYPVGRYNEVSPKVAKESGYKLALTTKPGLANAEQGLYELHRQRVVPDMTQEAFAKLLQP